MRKYKHCLTFLSALTIAINTSVYAAPVELSLGDSIALALHNNYDIKYVQSAREKSYWAVKEAEKSKGVSITFTHSDERYNSRNSVTDTYVYTNDFANNLSLNVPLYSGGSLEDKINQAQLNLKVADLDIAAAKQQLKQQVVSDYLTALEYRNEMQVDQNSVKNYTDHLNLVKAKFAAGLVAKTDILSSQVDLAKAEDTFVKAQNNYNNAIATLNNDIGLSHGTETKLKDDFKFEKYPLAMQQCLDYALVNRPEISQYQAKVTNAQYDVKIAQSDKLPQVSLTAQQGWSNDHFPGSENSNWLLKMTASMNVFDAGLTDTKINQARHNIDMVSDQAAKKRDAILLEVRQYYLNMQEAEKRINTNKISVAQAEENLMIQKARYEVGIGTNLDLLDSVLALDSAKKDYVAALYDYNINKALLEKAMGTPVLNK